MNFLHSVELKEPPEEVYVGSLAFNDFIDENNCVIIIYLENFKFRKNVDYKKVAKQMNDYFLYELICAMSRKDIAFETGNLSFSLDMRYDPFSGDDACESEDEQIVYSTEGELTVGLSLYSDSCMTNLANAGFYSDLSDYWEQSVAGIIIDTNRCR